MTTQSWLPKGKLFLEIMKSTPLHKYKMKQQCLARHSDELGLGVDDITGVAQFYCKR